MFNAENWGILWRLAINAPGPTIAAVALVVAISFSLSRLIDRGEIRGLKEQKQAVRDILEFEKKKAEAEAEKQKAKILELERLVAEKASSALIAKAADDIGASATTSLDMFDRLLLTLENNQHGPSGVEVLEFLTGKKSREEISGS